MGFSPGDALPLMADATASSWASKRSRSAMACRLGDVGKHTGRCQRGAPAAQARRAAETLCERQCPTTGWLLTRCSTLWPVL